MDVTHIPAALPPEITVSRDLVEFSLADDLETYGPSGPVALAWQWALTGEGPTPVSRRDWQQGAPDHATLLDESRWPYGDGWAGQVTGDEIQRARFLLWWLTARPDEEVPARFRRVRHAPGPAAVEEGSTSVSITEVYGGHGRRPFS
jgi:hypothetical protein